MKAKPRKKDALPEALSVQAFYSVADLARAANMTTPRMRRMLRGCGVQMFAAGRQLMAPLEEVCGKVPRFLENLKLAQKLLRQEAEDKSTRFENNRVRGAR